METPEHEGHYHLRLVQERLPGGQVAWTASHPQLPGCHVVRADPTAAVEDLAAVREEWIRRAGERGATVPEPSDTVGYELVLAPDHTADDAVAAETACSSQQSVYYVGFGGDSSM